MSAFCTLLFAQGTLNFTVLQTGGGTPLVSSSQTVAIGGMASPRLMFDFGFFTDENAGPNAFLDSLTVTVQDASKTAVLVTTDAGGSIWVPPSMGGISLADADVVRMIMAPPGDSPILGRGVAYTVTFSLAQFTGTDVTVFFDLFDNEDQLNSMGWYTPPRVISVPEPGFMALCGLASLVFLIRRKQTHADKGP
jgi:hypothetical protein